MGGRYIVGGRGMTMDWWCAGVGGWFNPVGGIRFVVGGSDIMGGSEIVMGGSDVIAGGTLDTTMQQEVLSSRDGQMGVKKTRRAVGVRLSRCGRRRSRDHQR